MDKLRYSKYEWLAIIQNIDSGKCYDVTHMACQIELASEWMTGMPGTLELTLVVSPDNDMPWLTKARNGMDEKHGHLVQFSVNGQGQFKGYVTRVEQDAGHIVKVTARDQIFFLTSKDYLYTENMTASEIFADVCDRKARIAHRIDAPARMVLDPYYWGRDYTMFDIIKKSIDKANVQEERQYT